MKSPVIRVLFCIVLTAGIPTTTCNWSGSTESDNDPNAIMKPTATTVDEALQMLNTGEMPDNVVSREEIQGMRVLPGLHANVERIRLENIVWAVEKDDAVLTNSHISAVDVFLEKESGFPVRIESVWPKGVPGTRFPAVEVYEHRMKNIRQEFVGIPKHPPKVPFSKAMEHAWHFQNAKQVVVYYVIESFPELGVPPRNVWVIHTWGTTPIPLVGIPGVDVNDVHEDALNHFRSTVDAETGRWYGTGSTPQPEVNPSQ